MHVKFDCKIITMEHVFEAMKVLNNGEHKKAVKSNRTKTSFDTKRIAQETMRIMLGKDTYYSLSSKETRSGEARVRRLLKKEEKETGRVRDTCFKFNRSSWRLITQEQMNKEAQETAEREAREDRIYQFCNRANVNPDDVDCYTHQVRINYEDFERIMAHYG